MLCKLYGLREEAHIWTGDGRSQKQKVQEATCNLAEAMATCVFHCPEARIRVLEMEDIYGIMFTPLTYRKMISTEI